jgi:hypothetical protein
VWWLGNATRSPWAGGLTPWRRVIVWCGGASQCRAMGHSRLAARRVSATERPESAAPARTVPWASSTSKRGTMEQRRPEPSTRKRRAKVSRNLTVNGPRANRSRGRDTGLSHKTIDTDSDAGRSPMRRRALARYVGIAKGRRTRSIEARGGGLRGRLRSCQCRARPDPASRAAGRGPPRATRGSTQASNSPSRVHSSAQASSVGRVDPFLATYRFIHVEAR